MIISKFHALYKNKDFHSISVLLKNKNEYDINDLYFLFVRASKTCQDPHNKDILNDCKRIIITDDDFKSYNDYNRFLIDKIWLTVGKRHELSDWIPLILKIKNFDPNTVNNKHGDSIVHIIAQHNNDEGLKKLFSISEKINFSKTNNKGIPPLVKAYINNHENIISIFHENGYTISRLKLCITIAFMPVALFLNRIIFMRAKSFLKTISMRAKLFLKTISIRLMA